MESRFFFSDLLEAVNGTGYMNGMKSAVIVPVGDVMYALNTPMKFDQIPGYDNIWQLYEDYAHLNGIGSYIVATTFYARLYNQSPVGLSVPSQYGSIDPGLVSTIQQSVWEVVKNFNPRNINPIGINDAVVTSQRMALVISASALLSNDLDGDSDALKIARTLVSAPTNGRLGRTADGNFRYGLGS